MKSNQPYIEYPLQRTRFDIPVGDLLDLEAEDREVFIRAFLSALSNEIVQGSMALKRRVTFKQEIADYRKVLRLPIDYYLLTDEKSKKRNVLAVGAPGQTHTNRSRTHMWQMVTKQGALADHISAQDDALLKRLTKLFDQNNKGKAGFRKENDLVPPTIYRYLQMNYSVGAAFPPFHARFLVSRFLPKQGKVIDLDPCAGWGGRMLGTLCANRADEIRYIGIDPAKRNKDAYEVLRGIFLSILQGKTRLSERLIFSIVRSKSGWYRRLGNRSTERSILFSHHRLTLMQRTTKQQISGSLQMHSRLMRSGEKASTFLSFVAPLNC